MSETSDILNERWVAEGRFIYTKPTDADDCVEIARCGIADSPSNLANAQAIAALPELLEALEKIADIAHRMANGGLKRAGEAERVGEHKAIWRVIRNTARKALAKAGIGGAE